MIPDIIALGIARLVWNSLAILAGLPQVSSGLT
jgi:hypothetical protein